MILNQMMGTTCNIVKPHTEEADLSFVISNQRDHSMVLNDMKVNHRLHLSSSIAADHREVESSSGLAEGASALKIEEERKIALGVTYKGHPA